MMCQEIESAHKLSIILREISLIVIKNLLHQVMLANVFIEHKNNVAYAAAVIADFSESNPNVSQFLPFH